MFTLFSSSRLPASAALASACALLAGFACLPAHASLGGAPSTFDNAATVRARALAATVPGSAVASNYSVRESTLDSGTVVREYVDAAGQVFAVSWNGPFMPDLRTLLGAHFATYTSEAAARRPFGRGQLQINRNDVVIEAGGHMRDFAGRAWIKAALPAGVTAEAIQ